MFVRPLFSLPLIGLLAACGSDIGSSPCDVANPPASCTDASLPDAAPEVRPDASPPAPDAVPVPDANCPSVVVDVQAVIPTVALVIDRSFSMTEDFGSTDRWTAEETALVDPVDGVVTKLASRIRFGATMYTTGNVDTDGDGTADTFVCPMLEEASAQPALDNYDAIATLFETYQPRGDTPTGESLAIVATELAALPPIDPDNPEPRFIVLSTDGEPDTCAHPNPENPEQAEEARQVSIEAVKAAHAAGIPTFVLSVGSDVGVEHLQDLANAGAGKPVADGNPNNNADFIVADNPDELVSAFDDVLGQVAKSCQFNLDGNITPGRESSGDVRLDGDALDFETDWRVLDSDTIELIGQACDDYLGDPNAIITAEFPCGAVSPE